MLGASLELGCWNLELPLRRSGLRRRFRDVGREILFPAAEAGHKTNAILFVNDADPALLLDVTPARKIEDLPAFQVAFGGKKEELHMFFHDPDLRDVVNLFVVKDARTDCLQARRIPAERRNG